MSCYELISVSGIIFFFFMKKKYEKKKIEVRTFTAQNII